MAWGEGSQPQAGVCAFVVIDKFTQVFEQNLMSSGPTQCFS